MTREELIEKIKSLVYSFGPATREVHVQQITPILYVAIIREVSHVDMLLGTLNRTPLYEAHGETELEALQKLLSTVEVKT